MDRLRDTRERTGIPKDFLPQRELLPCIFQSAQIYPVLEVIQEMLDVKALELHRLRKNAILDRERWVNPFHVDVWEDLLGRIPMFLREVLQPG